MTTPKNSVSVLCKRKPTLPLLLLFVLSASGCSTVSQPSPLPPLLVRPAAQEVRRPAPSASLMREPVDSASYLAKEQLFTTKVENYVQKLDNSLKP